jgi:hypothetical protein
MCMFSVVSNFWLFIMPALRVSFKKLLLMIKHRFITMSKKLIEWHEKGVPPPRKFKVTNRPVWYGHGHSLLGLRRDTLDRLQTSPC